MIKAMTIVQFPNKALTIALLAAVVNIFAKGELHNIVAVIYYLALIVWAYQEITSGVNWFRRGLGIVVLVYVFVQRLMH